jgi:hypothetical protein
MHAPANHDGRRRPTAAMVVPHSRRLGIQQSANMLCYSFTLLKLERKYLLLLISLLCVRRIDHDNVVADNNAHSRVWAVGGGSGAIGSSYGPIGIVL